MVATKLVIDTGSQTSDRLAERYGAAVVPLTIVLDGEDYLEGETLASDTFYDRLAEGAKVSTAAPAPGQFLEAYQAAADEGATAVLSVHLSGGLSGTVNSARIASEMSPIPVEVYDCETTGWGVDAITGAAGDALASGGDVATAVAAAQKVRERLLNIFVVGQPALFQRGGRAQILGQELEATSVLATGPSGLFEVAKVESVEGFVEAAARFLGEETKGEPIRLAIGDARSPAAASALLDAVTAAANIGAGDVVRYEIRPSLAAHLGAGTVAATAYTVS